MRLKVNVFFIHHFLPRLPAFVDSYYSPCGPLGITPGRFFYGNAKFWAEKLGRVNTYCNRTFLVRFGRRSGSFGPAMGLLARRSRAKIRTMARPNSPDMPPKRIKKVRLGVIVVGSKYPRDLLQPIKENPTKYFPALAVRS